VKWKSALVTDLSGSLRDSLLGHVVAARGSGGQYIRSYAGATQPGSNRQLELQAAVASAHAAWLALTQQQRDGWYTAADADSDGLGQAAFVATYVPRRQANVRIGGSTLIPLPTVAPVGLRATAWDAWRFGVKAGEWQISLTRGTPCHDAGWILIYRGDAMPATQKYYRKRRFRIAARIRVLGNVTAVDLHAVTRPDAAGEGGSAPPMPAVGQQIPLRIRFVADDGSQSALTECVLVAQSFVAP